MFVWDFAKCEGDRAFCDLRDGENNEFHCICGTKESLLRNLQNIYGIKPKEKFIAKR